jgi:GAF domain-containing protein
MSGAESLLQRYLRIPPQSDTDNTLRLLIRMGVLVTGADEGSLLVLDEAAGDLRFAMTIGDAGSEATLLGQRVPLGQGITGLAAATLEVQIGAPTFRDIRQSARLDPAAVQEAVMAAPMLLGEQLVGVITAVSFRAGKRFTTEDGRLFGGFAAIAGVLVDQAQRLQGLGDMAPALAGAEADIAASIAAITRRNPAALGDVAALLASVERLVAGT